MSLAGLGGRRKRCGSATSAPGSRAVSRFGAVGEQIYLQTRDHEDYLSLKPMSLAGLGGRRRHVALRQSSRGREHLVKSERSERLYLVIRDHHQLKIPNPLSAVCLFFRGH